MNQLVEQMKNSNDTFRRSQCRHTLPEGHRCGSPAMRGEKFCYYHHADRKPIADVRLRQARLSSFSLAQPRSRAAIQESLGEIIARLSQNNIDPRRAGLLLYALQIATTNLKDHQNAQLQTADQPLPQHQSSSPTSETSDQTSESGSPASKSVISTGAAQPRSGETCFSTDAARPTETTEEDPSFDTEIFPKPQPQLRPLTRATAATLLEALARHKGIQPQPGSLDDRKPTPETLPTLQASQEASEAPIRPRNPAERQIHSSIRPVLQQEALQTRNSRMSPTCLQLVISSHKVLPPEHLGYSHDIWRYITNLN